MGAFQIRTSPRDNPTPDPSPRERGAVELTVYFSAIAHVIGVIYGVSHGSPPPWGGGGGGVVTLKTFYKKTLLHSCKILLILSIPLTAKAQQEPMYTQFMFNQLAYNPATAGNFESPVVTAIYRKQWIGFDGAPDAQVLSYHQPLLGDRLGIGANLSRSSIGINRSVTLDLIYAYRIPMQIGHFCIGLQPSVRNFYQNWADDRLYSPTPAGTDAAIPTEPSSKWVVNMGAGLYYHNPDKGWYAGAAVPRILPNSIDFAELGGVLSRETFHLNAMAGLTFEPNEYLQIKPQLLLKFVLNAPFEAELNTMLVFQEKFHTGLTYRAGGDTNGAGESIDVLAGIQATDKLFFCLSYDIGLTRLRKFNNGSVEATVRWYINPPTGTERGTGLPL